VIELLFEEALRQVASGEIMPGLAPRLHARRGLRIQLLQALRGVV